MIFIKSISWFIAELCMNKISIKAKNMAKVIKTEVVIQAIPEKVWAILTDFDNYPNWNPFIPSIQGEVKVGNRINVRLEPPDAKVMNIKPKIIVYTINKEFGWIGHLLFTGLFDGEHKFELRDNGNGTTTFLQSENFEGILVPLLTKLLDNNTTRGFHQMNQKLKELSERL